MNHDYKWLESVMKKHGLNLYDVTSFIYEYMIMDLEHMYTDGEIDKDVEKLYESVIDDIKDFVTGDEAEKESGHMDLTT